MPVDRPDEDQHAGDGVETAAVAPPATPGPGRPASAVAVIEVVGTGPNGAITVEDVRQATRRTAFERPHRGRSVTATTRAHRLAGSLGVDLGTVVGSGPEGVITVSDVRRAGRTGSAPAGDPAAGVAEDESMRPGRWRSRQATGAQTPYPLFGVATWVDMSTSERFLAEEFRARQPESTRALRSALIVKAAALALREVPEMNGRFVDGTFEPETRVDPQCTIPLSNGEVGVLTLIDAASRSLDDLAAALRDPAPAGSAGPIPDSSTAGATIAIVVVGDRGIAHVSPTLREPNVAAVGVGSVIDRPWSRDGLVGVFPMLPVGLTADGRVSDEHRGATYLAGIRRRLEELDELLR